MALSNFPFAKGNSINRLLVFNGEGYHYWKTRMQIFMEVLDLNIWETIEIGPFHSYNSSGKCNYIKT